MSTPPTHQELQEMLAAAAVGALEQEDRERVLAHVQQCLACGSVLEEYRDVAASLTLVLPHRGMDRARFDRVRGRLMARARGGEEHGPGSLKTSRALQQPPKRAFLAGRWAGWTVAAALSGVLLMHHAVHRPLNYAWLVAGGLILMLVALGIYAGVQRGRVVRLTARLVQLEQESNARGEGSP